MNYLDREFTNDTDVFQENTRTLLCDGDLLIYRICCIHIEDDDIDKRLIANHLKIKVTEAMVQAGCGKYRFFLTTKENFRHFVSDQYKINRKDIERPVNLAWAKQWAVDHLGAEYETYLEADDLMAMNQNDSTVILSGDKDLRQVPGWHLNDKTYQLEFVRSIGSVWLEGDKVLFNGYKGLMLQCLTGDTTDSIIGCGKRSKQRYKTGKRKGEEYLKRTGIGPKEAMKMLRNCPQTKVGYAHVVKRAYQNLHGDTAMKHLEQECNLLMMVKNFNPETKLAQRWTYDGREEYMNITTGEIS